MTSSTIKAASNGGTSTHTDAPQRESGLAVLRQIEARGLISLACGALSETSDLGHRMHSRLYDRTTDLVPAADLHQQIQEALTCLGTAEHYLLMLDEVLDGCPQPPEEADAEPPW
jgi:hypothetical protein